MRKLVVLFSFFSVLALSTLTRAESNFSSAVASPNDIYNDGNKCDPALVESECEDMCQGTPNHYGCMTVCTEDPSHVYGCAPYIPPHNR